MESGNLGEDKFKQLFLQTDGGATHITGTELIVVMCYFGKCRVT